MAAVAPAPEMTVLTAAAVETWHTIEKGEPVMATKEVAPAAYISIAME